MLYEHTNLLVYKLVNSVTKVWEKYIFLQQTKQERVVRSIEHSEYCGLLDHGDLRRFAINLQSLQIFQLNYKSWFDASSGC